MTVQSGQVISRKYRLGENAYLAGFPFGSAGRFMPDPRKINPDVLSKTECWLVPRLHSALDTDYGHSADAVSDEERQWLKTYGIAFKAAATTALEAR